MHLRPLVARQDLGILLALADLHILPQMAGMDAVVLPSKLANMLASARPVIATAEADSQLAQEVAGCGVITAPGDGAALGDAAIKLCADHALRHQLGAKAKERAAQLYNGSTTLRRFADAIEALCRT